MLKHLVIAVSMSAFVAGHALAQAPAQPGAGAAEPQASDAATDKCLESAMSLAQSAEQKQLADTKLDKIEQMLARMEDLCDAKQDAEAQAMAKDIEKAINTD